MLPPPRVIDLGRLPYAAAYDLQRLHVEEVIAAREAGGETGRILLVEHDPPVITVTRRPTAAANLLASSEELQRHGIEVAQTDRGGDITYHGPGQLVVYPILDLNLLNLRLHDYMRLLESAVIETCREFGVEAHRDACATGVWTTVGRASRPPSTLACLTPATPPAPTTAGQDSVSPPAKICAMGVRIRRWVSMHGLALNVTTNLDHFRLIVPCGLAGRQVTSLAQELGDACPAMERVKETLVRKLAGLIVAPAERAVSLESGATGIAARGAGSFVK